MGVGGQGSRLGPPKTQFFEEYRKTVKQLGKERISHTPAQRAMADNVILSNVMSIFKMLKLLFIVCLHIIMY